MKKFFALFICMVLLITLSSSSTCEAAVSFKSPEEATAYVLKNCTLIPMEFKGESSKWSASLSVKNIETQSNQMKPGFTFTLTPKQSLDTSVSYKIISNNGTIEENVKLTEEKKPIEFTTTSLIPEIDEDIVVCITYPTGKKNYLVLEQKLPENVKVTPTQAAQILTNEYHTYLHQYFPLNSTFRMDIKYTTYWQINVYNNDKTDVLASILINGITGKSEGLKVAE